MCALMTAEGLSCPRQPHISTYPNLAHVTGQRDIFLTVSYFRAVERGMNELRVTEEVAFNSKGKFLEWWKKCSWKRDMGERPGSCPTGKGPSRPPFAACLCEPSGKTQRLHGCGCHSILECVLLMPTKGPVLYSDGL